MKNRIKKGLVYVAIGFVLMFAGRLTYGYLFSTKGAPLPDVTMTRAGINALIFGEGGRNIKGNYASEKLKVQRGYAPEPVSVDQKYEKVASVESRTDKFDDDE